MKTRDIAFISTSIVILVLLSVLFINYKPISRRYITETKMMFIDEIYHQEFRDVYRIKYRLVDISIKFNVSTGLYDTVLIPYGRIENFIPRRNNISKEIIIGNVYEIIYLPYQKGIRDVPVLILIKEVHND